MVDPADEPATSRIETTTEARAGSTPGVTRYVLIVGTVLVVIIFIVLFWIGRS